MNKINNSVSRKMFGNAPETNKELAKKAKLLSKKAPKDKYKMNVYLSRIKNEQQVKGKLFAELRATKKSKLEKSKLKFGNNYPNKIFIYDEIKPIKINLD